MEFKQFYDTVKRADQNINIVVNFSYLNCLEGFITEKGSNNRIVDIAAFTITAKKLRESSTYMADENAIAGKLKKADPHLQIIPLIAIYEYPSKGEKLPSADWVRKTGLDVLKDDNFDGVMYYSWESSNYMGRTIKDIADDPQYIKAFSDVFKAARTK